MSNQKKQALKRFTYICCLSLSSIIITSDVHSMDASEDKSGDYRETHNRYARKYGFNNHIIQPRVRPQNPTSEGTAEEFNRVTKKLREQKEKELEEINTLGTKVATGVGDLTKTVIEKNIEDKTAKSMFLRLNDEVVSFLKRFFS